MEQIHQKEMAVKDYSADQASGQLISQQIDPQADLQAGPQTDPQADKDAGRPANPMQTPPSRLSHSYSILFTSQASSLHRPGLS